MTENEASKRMANYCSIAEHCRSEVREKLEHQALEESVIERILNRLEKEGFIDHERYARSFINDKIRFVQWGKMKIRRALYLKQIPSEIVDRELEDVDDIKYLRALRELLEKKKKTINAKNDYEMKGKLVQFALGKGFEIEYIEKCM
jgi:regulatory protein